MEGLLIFIGVMAVIILLILSTTLKYIEYRHEFDYINMEIKRTHGREKDYWKREKRRLTIKMLFR